MGMGKMGRFDERKTSNMHICFCRNGDLYLDSRSDSQNLYDLYAVCNHSGYSPNSGHYTGMSSYMYESVPTADTKGLRAERDEF